MQAQDLVLRDVHVPAAPSLWPPAPGWWLVAAVVLAIVTALLLWRQRQRRKWQARQRLFDEAGRGMSSAAQIAAMSELLRRAARGVDKHADRLQGDAWLQFLDGKRGRDFSAGPGRLLLDGGYRREVPENELAAIRAVAHARFLELMAKKQ